MPRIYLSPPHMGPDERQLLLAAFDSNWIAPVGPDLTAFEQEFAALVGRPAVALASGSAALHLALVALGVATGDEVAISSFTFAATANAVRYVGAQPVLIDSDRTTWNIDPALLEAEFGERAAAGRPLPTAVIVVDLYGLCAAYDDILPICERYDVPLIVDAAESLGSTYRGRPAGSFGAAAAFSFNGNKIITTSGGGMLVSDDPDLVDRVRHLSTQAREPAPHYEHERVGYNYRLSNLLAAIGRGQLRVLTERVERRRAIFARYQGGLGDLPGIGFMPVDVDGHSNCWLTCITIDPTAGITPEVLRLELEDHDIESRPLWKPMHMQPVFRDAPARLSGVSTELFERGLCLPSGTAMSDDDLEHVIALIRGCWQPG